MHPNLLKLKLKKGFLCFGTFKRTDVLAAGKYKKIIAARSLVCFWGVRELGISQIQLALRFGISQPALSMAVSRGETIGQGSQFLYPLGPRNLSAYIRPSRAPYLQG